MRIYKYSPVNDYSLENLKNAKLFFNNPEEFKDKFDVNLPFEDIDSNVFYQESIEFFNDNPDLFLKYQKIFEESKISKEVTEFSISEMMKLMKETYLGITCFTDTDCSDYMWKEYGDNDKGFCLCFETEHDEAFFKDLTKINYSKKLPTVNLLAKNLAKEMETLTTTKLTKYIPENEFRLFKHSFGLHQYNRQCLVGISFGKFNTNRKELLNIITENYGSHIDLEKI